MLTISQLTTLYSKQLDYLDIELIISNSLAKSREFVLAHPEYKLTASQQKKISALLNRRMAHEPIAYILGHKEFYGLDFIVNKHTLVPRPETEMMIELATKELHNKLRNSFVIDIGTGSGNIIISIANLDSRLRGNDKVKYFGIDTSSEAIRIAKKNAATHDVDKKIKFLHGNLLEPLKKELSCSMLHDPCSIIITANLPYLSKEIYDSAPIDVKKFEPKSALYSAESGLAHYRKLLEQIKEFRVPCSMLHACLSGRQVSCFMEFSPEQKQPFTKLIKSILPAAKIEFKKDLAGKWRVCKITL